MTATHILPNEELTKLVASAKSEDHRKLANHYAAHAADHETDAKDHEALAKQYEKRLHNWPAKHVTMPRIPWKRRRLCVAWRAFTNS